MGSVAAVRQVAQDRNAAASPAAAVQRQLAKASSNYRNASWDLVDAVKEGKVDLAKAKVEELPEELRKMTPEQRHAYVESKAKERREIQQRIVQLNKDREKYVAEEMKKRVASGTDTLDSAIIKTVRMQANARQFTFEP
jgi:DNA primase large subunit